MFNTVNAVTNFLTRPAKWRNNFQDALNEEGGEHFSWYLKDKYNTRHKSLPVNHTNYFVNAGGDAHLPCPQYPPLLYNWKQEVSHNRSGLALCRGISRSVAIVNNFHGFL
jgi:hypothetical protein